MDVRVHLQDGSYHEVDSSERAFKIAASMAFREAARRADPVLLEPIMEVEVVVPEESMGEVIADLNARSGQIDEVGFRGGKRLVRALVAMRQLFGYSTDVRSLTQGRATFTMRFHRFDTMTKSG